VDKPICCHNHIPYYECILFYINKYTIYNDFFSLFHCRYVAVYFSILYFRYRAGIVTKEMLSVPKIPFLIVGILESLALTSGMAAAGTFTLILPLNTSFPVPLSTVYFYMLDKITSKHYRYLQCMKLTLLILLTLVFY